MPSPSVQSSEPAPLPSLPPSPTADVTGSSSWQHKTEQREGTPIDTSELDKLYSDNSKGKRKLVESSTSYADADAADTTSDESSETETSTDEDAEARKVAENLRRWEAADRQRRKVARTVTGSGSMSASIVGDATRRAGSLWSGRRSSPRQPLGAGSHRALRTQESEDGVPLEELDPGSPTSPRHARKPPASTRSSRQSEPENPFENPSHIRSGSSSSLNTPLRSAVMSESSDPSFDPAAAAYSLEHGKRRGHPPPLPLDLPRPRTPPPPSAIPLTNKLPESIPEISASIPRESEEYIIEEPETRWWTDWLCGCTEGPERGGDHQAGRTNPSA